VPKSCSRKTNFESSRRTIRTSVVQGLVSCQKCAMPLARTSTRTSASKIPYYKCIGALAGETLGGPVCDNAVCPTGPPRPNSSGMEVNPTAGRPHPDTTGNWTRRLAAARFIDPTKNMRRI